MNESNGDKMLGTAVLLAFATIAIVWGYWAL